jgi:hypothetical protein
MKTPTLCLTFLAFFVSLVTAAADRDFEEATDLKASDVLPDRLLVGEHHRVDEVVRNDGYLNYYLLHSDYGDWEIAGTPLLAVRVREVEALATLDDVSKTKVFIKAAADAGVGQLKVIKQFATQPIQTVTGIPKGIGRLFARYKRDAEEAMESAEEFLEGEEDAAGGAATDAEKKESNQVVKLTESYFGVSGAERAWAQELGTDPYTRNEVLRSAIKSVAWADRLGRFGMKFVPIPVIPGADVIAEVNGVVWSKNPYELEDLNRARLAATGADEELIDAYLRNPYLTPTQITYLTAAIAEMDGVDGRDGILRQALATETDAEAGFFLKSVTMLAWYHLNRAPLSRVLTEHAVPRGVTTDGNVVLLLATDYVHWTESVAGVASAYAELSEEDEDGIVEVWLLGGVSERTASELEALGIDVHTNLVELRDDLRNGM